MSLTMKVYKKLFKLFFLLTLGCASPPKLVVNQGLALGTSYTLKLHTDEWSEAAVENVLDSLFYVVNQSMSTYLPNSDISKINAGQKEIVVDKHFITVYHKATEVWKATEGLFDPTVGSLVNAYGFGPEKGIEQLTDQQRDSLLVFTGWQNLYLSEQGLITKKDSRTYLDFNALAKGYTLDLIGQYFEQKNIVNYLLEIGGELRAKGINPLTQKPWRIAIDHPNSQGSRHLIRTLPLSNQALATSGNYRKYRIDPQTGKKYVHSINPRTGLATQTPILSASVIAPDCMTADAWATALMLLPLAEGQKLIAQDPQLQAYWIVATDQGEEEYFSQGWPQD